MSCLAHVLEAAPFNPKVPSSKSRIARKSLNDKLYDSILRHRHAIFFAENSVAREMLRAYREALDAIEASLLRVARREDAMTNLRQIRVDRLRSLEARLGEALQHAGVSTTADMTAALELLIEKEWAFQANLLSGTLPTHPRITLNLTGPDINLVRQVIEQPMGGLNYATRFLKNHGESVPLMRQSLATSVSLGEGFDAAARRLRKRVGGMLMSRAVNIARSEVQRAANHTAQQFYMANADVVKGIEIVETLDHYTIVCAVDGKVGPFAGFTYKSYQQMRGNIRIRDAKGTWYSPIPEDKIDPDTKNFFNMMRPILAAAIGPMGQNMHFFAFPAKSNTGLSIADPREQGVFAVQLGENTFRWRLPLGSLLPPKICPTITCKEKCSGAWNFCEAVS